MGFWQRLFGGGVAARVAADPTLGIAPVSIPSAIRSPWTDAELPVFVYEDIFGGVGPVSRALAMKVPAVVAARSLIIGRIAHVPLRALAGDQLLEGERQPTFLYRTNGPMSPWQRMAHTLDDLMFYGDALWATARGERRSILHAAYVRRDLWRIDPDTALIQVRTGQEWRNAKTGEVLYFPGPFEGLVNVGADTIRGALDLERNWRNQARVPLPGIVLQERDDNGMTTAEMQEWVAAVAEQRRKPDGAVMGLPAKITATFAPQDRKDLLVEGRNAVKLDIANFLGLEPSMLGAALPKASLNYETQESNRREFDDRMTFWTSPIEARLSEQDVVPEGTRVRFDFNPTPDPALTSTGPTVED